MARVIKNNWGYFVVSCFVFLLVTLWIYSAWPRIWEEPSFPPEIQEAYAATESLYVDGFNSVLAEWVTFGDSPWLNNSTDNYIYTKANGV